MAETVKIKLIRSVIGRTPVQRATVRSLGLKKIGSTVEKNKNSAILGMIKKVSHLVKIEDLR